MEDLLLQWQPIAITAAMMILDMITGFAGGVKTQTVESRKMRDGLWHKAGFFLLIAFSLVWEIGALWINIEISQLNIGFTLPEVPAVGAVCAFIVVTEAVSICENLCVLNPEIEQLPIIKNLKPHGEDGTANGPK